MTDQAGRKGCQKKREDVSCKILQGFFQKYFVVHELWGQSNFRSVHMYDVMHRLVYFKRYCK